MKSGKIVEQGNSEDIFINPKHPYTQDLLKASPIIHKLINND
jgi:oligopeptide/dipeptide ABC transporter ATP-binding protein